MNENREVIIPDVSGVLSFLAKEINSIPDDNDMVKGMEVISRIYPIVQGRIQGIPLYRLIENTDMKIAEKKESSSLESTLGKPGRFYDELGL